MSAVNGYLLSKGQKEKSTPMGREEMREMMRRFPD
tara:strand:+ start:545 stop:649 length:105 start_codon:yes stop_codon:yes gene_type:complete